MRCVRLRWPSFLTVTARRHSSCSSPFNLAELPDRLQAEFDVVANQRLLMHMMKSPNTKLKVPGSWRHPVSWKCSRCETQWVARPAHRTDYERHQAYDCPKCRSLSTSNDAGGIAGSSQPSLLVAFPQIAAQWDVVRNSHYTNEVKNALSDVSVHCVAEAWWKCSRCSRAWKESTRSRVMRFQAHSDQSTSAAVCPDCDCASNPPSAVFLSDHHVLLTQALLRPHHNPSEVLLSSDILLPWRCPYCQHEYRTSVANRHLRGEGCPQCTGAYASPLNLLCIQRPDVLKELTASVSAAKLNGITIHDSAELPFVCRRCHSVYRMAVRSRCLLPKGTSGCSKCFHAASLTSVRHRGRVSSRRKLQEVKREVAKVVAGKRCHGGLALADRLLRNSDKNLSN